MFWATFKITSLRIIAPRYCDSLIVKILKYMNDVKKYCANLGEMRKKWMVKVQLVIQAQIY